MIGRRVRRLALLAAAMLPLAVAGGVAQVAPPLPASFDVVDADHGGRFVARITVDGTGRIAAERIDPQRRDWFETIVREVNQQKTLLVPAPPPSSAPRFAAYGNPVGRDDPGFLVAMKAYLSRFHGLELR